MSLAMLFPGQGSQYVGMGASLAEALPLAAETLAEADEVLGFDLTRLMWEGPEAELTQTENAQPAILAHSVAALRVATRRLGTPAFAAGHSLGEFSAYVAGGAISFGDALRTVRLRGTEMSRVGRARPGTMAAVLGLSDEAVEEVCASVDVGGCWPANFNTDGQVVISGDVAGVERGMELATAAGAKRVVQLKVSGAFHSELMEPAAAVLAEWLSEMDFGDPSVPVVSNVTGTPVRTGSEARELLIRQVTAPVRWSQSIRTMLGEGVDRFVELGPGKVLCTLNRKNARECSCMALGEPDDFESLE